MFEIVLDTRSMSAELHLIGVTGGPGLTSGSIGLAEREKRINVSQTVRLASFSATGLESEAAPSPPARVLPRPAGRLFNSFLSPVVNYHGLGRAAGFGDVRTLQHSHPSARRLRDCLPAENWLDLASERASGSPLFRLATSRPASFPAAFPLGSC